jgi:hypothetical protein
MPKCRNLSVLIGAQEVEDIEDVGVFDKDTKENGSSWIFELCLTWANALQPVQRSAFSLGKSRAAGHVEAA